MTRRCDNPTAGRPSHVDDEVDAALARALLARHERGLSRYCLARLGASNPARRALGHALARAHRQLGQAHAGRRLSTWLYGLAEAECRAEERRSGEPARQGPPAAGGLAGLDEQARRALALAELSGLDATQIGALMGRTEADARELVHAARRALIAAQAAGAARRRAPAAARAS